MKRSGLLLVLFGLCIVVHGQNLVPKPGFEEYKILPYEEGLYFMEATYRHKFHVEFLAEIDLGVDTVHCAESRWT